MRAITVVLLCVVIQLATSANYTVNFRRVVSAFNPVVSSQAPQSNSVFKWNYNTAVVPHKDGYGLLVRCQNQADPKDPYSVTQSVLGYSNCVDVNKWKFTNITEESVVFSPARSDENYGTEDPRVVYRASNGLYYLLYSAVQKYDNGTIVSRLALATSPNPPDRDSWTRYGPIIPTESWSKSGAMLIRDGFPGPHYLIFGDSSLYPGLQMATSSDLIHWKVSPGLFLETRRNNFDSSLVEAGPMPLRLSDGNYLFIYNSARHGYPSRKPGWDVQYNVGWVILDGKDPTKIIQRSEHPLFSPVTEWEIGNPPYLGLTPNVVFLEGWIADSSFADTFKVFYGAADSVTGAGEITVVIS